MMYHHYVRKLNNNKIQNTVRNNEVLKKVKKKNSKVQKQKTHQLVSIYVRKRMLNLCVSRDNTQIWHFRNLQ